jgi:hypothetical protein
MGLLKKDRRRPSRIPAHALRVMRSDLSGYLLKRSPA